MPTLSTLEWIFIAIGGFGLVILFLSAIGGELSAHIDVSTEIHADTDLDHGFDGPSWHSFTVLAAGLAGLGLSGFAAAHYDLPSFLCWSIAVAGGALLWAFVLFALIRPLARSQYNDVLQTSSLVDSEARVILAVPQDGIGQIDLATPSGGYLRLTARSIDNVTIPTGTQVLIVEMVDGIAYIMQNPNKQLET